jgi:energy-coupling factor transporter ATP-binding protein EcfA2
MYMPNAPTEPDRALTTESMTRAIAPFAVMRPKSGLRDAARCDLELPYRKSFFPLGYSVEILANDPAVLIAAEESFGHVRLTRQATQLQINVAVLDQEPGENCLNLSEPSRHAFGSLFSLVADRDNQSLLDLNTGVNFTWITAAALKNRPYFRSNFLEKVAYLLLGASVVTDLHAACIVKNGKGILLCGSSGAGKSTLAYACARSGWTYTSDDTSYLINDAHSPRVIGHCHRARFRPESRALFPELAERAVTRRMEGKPSIEVPIAELPVADAAAEADAHGVVFLNRSAAAESCCLVRLPQGTATERMRRDLFSTGEIRVRHEEMLEIFWNVPTYELRYCHLKDGVDALESLVRQI